MENTWNCEVRLNFFTKTCLANDYFSCDPLFVILAWVQKWKYYWKTHETVKSARIFSQKHVSRTITFHMINISWFWHEYKIEIFLKYSWDCVVRLKCIHENMSHEQLPFTWSTFRHSSKGTKLKYFWKTHETVQSAWIFSQKHVSPTIKFHLVHILWF